MFSIPGLVTCETCKKQAEVAGEVRKNILGLEITYRLPPDWTGEFDPQTRLVLCKCPSCRDAVVCSVHTRRVGP